MRRFATVLASLTIIAGLSACCCPCGGFPRGGGGPVNINVPPIVVNPDGNRRQDGNVKKPQDDLAIAAVKAHGGSVIHENNNPNGPVVDINLVFRNLNDADLRPLLSPFPQLRKLRLSQNQGITGVGFRDLANLQRLEELDVSGCRISDEGMKAIAALHSLKVLNVSNNKFTDVGMREMGKLGQLEDFNASGILLNGPGMNEPTDDAIKELGMDRQLRKLELSNTHVGDQSLMEFAQLPQLRELVVGADVTNAGVNALSGHPGLEKLVFITNSKINKECVPALRSMPKLRQVAIVNNFQAFTQIRKGLIGTKVQVKQR